MVTNELLALRAISLTFDEEALGDGYPPMGAEAMRTARYEGVRALADEVWAEVRDVLEPHRAAIARLAGAILAAPDRTLAGKDLDAAIVAALAASPA